MVNLSKVAFIPWSLGWLTGILPSRARLNYFSTGNPVWPIKIIPILSFYSLYTILINIVHFAIYLDRVTYQGPGAQPGQSNSTAPPPQLLPPPPQIYLKDMFFRVYNYLVVFVNYYTRFYFMYKGRELLLLIQRLQAHKIGNDQSGYRIPFLVTCLLCFHFLIRVAFQIDVRIIGSVERLIKDEYSYLSVVIPFVPIKCAVFVTFFEFILFAGAVVPMEFAILCIVPLVRIFEDLCSRMVAQLDPKYTKGPSGVSGDDVDKLPAVSGDEPWTIIVKQQPSVGKSFNLIKNELDIDRGGTSKGLLDEFTDIANYFETYNEIFGPTIMLLFSLSMCSVINNLAGLWWEKRYPVYTYLIIIAWEVSIMSFIEVGGWVHKRIDACQEQIQKALIIRQNYDAKISKENPLAYEVAVVASFLSGWKWKLRGARELFLIDRSLYQMVLTFMLSYTLMLFQLNAAVVQQQRPPNRQ